MVYGYRWSVNGSSRTLFQILGKSSLGKMGTSMAIGDPFGDGENDVLAVSFPTAGWS